MSLVTVAIPYATGPLDYLVAATESLLNQGFERWRAVILDDSQGGNQRIADIAKRDWRISYLRNDGPHGIGNAWNACIDAVDTELFCLLHSDDELESNYLSTMIQLAESYPDASLLFCGATIIDKLSSPTFSLADKAKDLIRPGGEPILLYGAAGVRSLTLGNYIMCPTMMYRREAIGPRRFSSEHRFVLDLRFTLSVLLCGGSIVGTNRKCYRYRRHAEQTTKRLAKNGERFSEELDLFREIEGMANDMGSGWTGVRSAARLRLMFRLNALISGDLRAALA